MNSGWETSVRWYITIHGHPWVLAQFFSFWCSDVLPCTMQYSALFSMNVVWDRNLSHGRLKWKSRHKYEQIHCFYHNYIRRIIIISSSSSRGRWSNGCYFLLTIRQKPMLSVLGLAPSENTRFVWRTQGLKPAMTSPNGCPTSANSELAQKQGVKDSCWPSNE